jgi:hypothetical protein
VWEDVEVPILDVEDALRDACGRFDVKEIVCDPFRWRRSMQILEREGLPIVEYPQQPARMVPATQAFYQAVVNGGLTHNGDRDLARHFGNAHARTDARGTQIRKASKHSTRRIDLAVAALMAFDRAAQYDGTILRRPLTALLGRVSTRLHLGTSGDGSLRPADQNQCDVVAGNRRADADKPRIARPSSSSTR